MQPVIGITVGELVNLESGKIWLPVIYGQFRTYTDAVVRAGGAPFIMPLVDDNKILRRLYDQCNGLLLSGGHDIEDSTHGELPARIKVTTSPKRNKQEKQLLTWALEDDKPVLGICRGMQLINVALGGSLYHDIENDLKTDINHTHGIDEKDLHRLSHQITIEPGSCLKSILGKDKLSTNSLHHQAVKDLGDSLVITARAEDGVTEAIELPGKRFVIGVQSHPEALEAEAEQSWRKLFKAFISAAAG